MKRLFATSFVFVLVAACSQPFDEKPERKGVDDVKKACEIRATWARAATSACVDCTSISQAPVCGCPAFQQAYIGQCVDQARAHAIEPSCEGTADCIAKCAATDCDCIDRCYVGKPRCRELASAVDGCVADVCDAYCR